MHKSICVVKPCILFQGNIYHLEDQYQRKNLEALNLKIILASCLVFSQHYTPNTFYFCDPTHIAVVVTLIIVVVVLTPPFLLLDNCRQIHM